MIEDHKSTAKEELKWRAEFETLGREAVSQRDQTLNGCCAALIRARRGGVEISWGSRGNNGVAKKELRSERIVVVNPCHCMMLTCR
jgi:hypothetical protein